MTAKDLKTPFISRDDNFNKFINILDGRDGVEDFNNPKFTVGDTHLSYRVISHWGKKGILPKIVNNEGGWHKFTLTERVWLKIASRLRDFGFSLTKIARIQKQIMWSGKKNSNHTYPFLELYIIRAGDYQEDCYIIVLADGTVDIGSSTEIELAKSKLFPNKRDMLLISLKGILSEFNIDVKKAKMLMPTSLQELLVSNILERNKNKNEMNMKFNKGTLKEVETSEAIPENPDYRKINEILKKEGSFGEVTTKYQDGNPEAVHIKRRQRFK